VDNKIQINALAIPIAKNIQLIMGTAYLYVKKNLIKIVFAE